MADAVAVILDGLAARGHDPRLENVSAAVRFDVVDGRRTHHWLLSVKNGDVQVSQKRSAADLVVRCERMLADRLFTGKANAMSAVLRGELTVEGSADLLVLIQRLLPRPRAARRKGVAAGYARGSR
jgi:alkyl sulfatase BDS1-like metallo-beta-lactamase superfamily hydrolase